jgi:ParB family transcriptional regulator, chromosome partitioning protein
MAKITDDVLDVLRRSEIVESDGEARLELPDKLTPALYAKSKKVLVGLGWKWNTKRQTHLAVKDNAVADTRAAIDGGEYVDAKKDLGFFATPEDLAYDVVWHHSEVGELGKGDLVLEPSAGDGALVRAILQANRDVTVHAVEVDFDRQKQMYDSIDEGQRVRVEPWCDTIEHHAAAQATVPTPVRYAAAVMNPPFALPGQPNAWLDHIELVLPLLKPGARLTAIVPASFEHRQDKRHAAFRQLVKDRDGVWERLPDDAFKESGTSVSTCVLSFYMPEVYEIQPPVPDAEPDITASPEVPEVEEAAPDPAGERPSRMVTVRLDQIDRREDQPREHFDEDALRELAESIRQRGLLQPPTVRAKGDGRYEIVMGERRWRALQRLQDGAGGWREVQVRLVDETDDDEAFIDAMAENINRQDMRPMEEARGYGRLIDGGRTVADVAALFGKQPEQVAWRLSLLKLIPEAAEALEKQQLRPWFAGELAKLNPGNQFRLFTRYVRGEFESEKEAIAVAKAMLAMEGQEVIVGSVEDDSEEARADRQQKARVVKSMFDQLARLTATLDEIAAADPEDLNIGLEGKLSVAVDRLGAVARSVAKAQGKLREARGMQLANQDETEQTA